MNKKNQQPYAIPNTQIWVFFTNFDDAIALDEDDRRFWVHRALPSTPEPEDYFKRLYGWFEKERGAAKVAGWLKQRDVSQFNPAARPPMTAAKRSMLDQSQPAQVRWLRDLFREGGAFENRTVITAGDVRAAGSGAAWDDNDAPGEVNDRHVTAALKSEQFVPSHRVRLGNGMRQLWFRDPSGLMRQLSAQKLRDRYDAEAAPAKARGNA